MQLEDEEMSRVRVEPVCILNVEPIYIKNFPAREKSPTGHDI